MEMMKIQTHRNRLPGDVQSLHHRNNGEGTAHSAMGPKDPFSTVIQ